MSSIDLTGAIYKIIETLINTNIISTAIISRYSQPRETLETVYDMDDIENKYSKIKEQIEQITKNNTEQKINKLIKIGSNFIPFRIELDNLYDYFVNGIIDKNNQKIDFIEYVNKNHSEELTSFCFSNDELKHPTILLYLIRCGLNTKYSVYEQITCKKFLSYDIYSTIAPDIFLQDAKTFFMRHYLPDFTTNPKYKRNSYLNFLLDSKKKEEEEKRNIEQCNRFISSIFNNFITLLGRLTGGSKSLGNKRITGKRITGKRRKSRKSINRRKIRKSRKMRKSIKRKRR